MATKRVSSRIEEEMLQKLGYVVDYEGRSINRGVLRTPAGDHRSPLRIKLTGNHVNKMCFPVFCSPRCGTGAAAPQAFPQGKAFEQTTGEEVGRFLTIIVGCSIIIHVCALREKWILRGEL